MSAIVGAREVSAADLKEQRDDLLVRYADACDQRDDLLAALVDVIRLELGETYEGSTPEQAEAMKRARAAIAKARGER